MPHPVSLPDSLEALERSGRAVVEFFSSLPEPAFFEGDSDHWSPAHHVVHLTRASVAVEKALRSHELPPHPTGTSRTFAEVRDAAATTLAATPKDRLLERGRTVVLPDGATQAEIVGAFASASAAAREAAATWSEEALDRQAIPHPLLGQLTVREMLHFFVVHEWHHLKGVRSRMENAPSS